MAPSENTELTLQVVRSDIRHLQADTDRRFEAVDKRFDAVDKRFEAVDKRFDGMDKKIDDLREKFDDLRNQFFVFKDSLNAAKLWAIGMYIGLAGGLLYVIAKVAKWL